MNDLSVRLQDVSSIGIDRPAIGVSLDWIIDRHAIDMPSKWLSDAFVGTGHSGTAKDKIRSWNAGRLPFIMKVSRNRKETCA
ncbi:hypothetical protein [Cohnella rhizosphaerae]|uniref:Uncharacterized protein n=1 Tax=Cohnella rhizosphaerae TaxID=1457232 RepID=A0A9X4KSN7_9BACL|nr:hypothetical protein [Cohnella rhizosphaerae]MDG0807999.1 hypothetical protein [Cohnella rhizosphaerae]